MPRKATKANAILRLKELLNDNFTKVVELILNSKGNVIVSGIGKSANIAQKIVATLNSIYIVIILFFNTHATIPFS